MRRAPQETSRVAFPRQDASWRNIPPQCRDEWGIFWGAPVHYSTVGTLTLEAWIYKRGGIGQSFCFLCDHQMHCSLRKNFGNKMAAPWFCTLNASCSISRPLGTLSWSWAVIWWEYRMLVRATGPLDRAYRNIFYECGKINHVQFFHVISWSFSNSPQNFYRIDLFQWKYITLLWKNTCWEKSQTHCPPYLRQSKFLPWRYG